MSHLAELLIDLGCYTAVNLDGGGSANMVASTMWTDGTVTVNSPTETRKVVNAVGVVLNKEEINPDEEEIIPPEPFGIEIKADKEFAFAASEVKLSLAVYDDNKRPVEYDEEELRWYCNDGKVENFVFTSAFAIFFKAWWLPYSVPLI
jgi:hypothetical protein